jgi:AraC-like DNA-binding protein
MGVSLIINFADAWTTGRSLATSGLLPHACVVGPVTQSRILGLGRSVRATGAVILPELTSAAFGVPASELVDQIVPLEDLWTRDEVEHFFAALAPLDAWRGPSLVKHELIARIGRPGAGEPVGQTAPRLIQLHAGRVSIDGMAKSHGLSRKQFARRFTAAAGVPPKLFARVTRFQRLVHTLLTTDVSRWACVPASMGLCDQAHMINEFHAFAGSSPTSFFRPHGIQVDPGTVQVRGRPSEWLRESTS